MTQRSVETPLIVGIGGTLREHSSSELALKLCLEHTKALGARTELFSTSRLDLPHYAPEGKADRPPEVMELLAALRRASGVIISSPCYHGSVSGLLKNALDFATDIDDEKSPLLTGRVVGLIACAYGPQATATTLIALRSIVHALRAWPTPVAVPINTLKVKFSPDGSVSDPAAMQQLRTVAAQVVEFVSSPKKITDADVA